MIDIYLLCFLTATGNFNFDGVTMPSCSVRPLDYLFVGIELQLVSKQGFSPCIIIIIITISQFHNQSMAIYLLVIILLSSVLSEKY